MMDDLTPLDCPDYESQIQREYARLDIKKVDTSELADLFAEVQQGELLPSIETVIYASANIFTGEVESMKFTYLESELKQYNLSSGMDKASLAKDKRDPFASLGMIGQDIVDIDKIQLELQNNGEEFISLVEKSNKFQ